MWFNLHSIFYVFISNCNQRNIFDIRVLSQSKCPGGKHRTSQSCVTMFGRQNIIYALIISDIRSPSCGLKGNRTTRNKCCMDSEQVPSAQRSSSYIQEICSDCLSVTKDATRVTWRWNAWFSLVEWEPGYEDIPSLIHVLSASTSIWYGDKFMSLQRVVILCPY